MKARQLDLIPPPPKARRDRLIKRGGCRNWHARFYVAGQWHQRSTFTRDKKTAKTILACWKMQYARRGAPSRGKANLDRA